MNGWRGVIAFVVAAAVVGTVLGLVLPSINGSSREPPLNGSSPSHSARIKPETPKAPKLTPVDRAANALPVHQQPLPVAQYVTGLADADIVARMQPRDFYCHRTLHARRSAVAWLYRTAAASLRRQHVTQFTLAVGLLDDRAEHFPLYARVNDGIVSLTPTGRAPGRCSAKAP